MGRHPARRSGRSARSVCVRRKPGLLRCAGAASLHIGDRIYALEDFTPAAHLPDSWADAWIDALIAAGIRRVTTIENEFPFLSYVEEAGGPLGLASRGEVAVYTGGFPTPRLTSSLAALAARSGARFQHWGDADVGGLRIWWFLRSRLARPLRLVRTTAAWLASESSSGGRPLTSVERQALVRTRGELARVAGADIEDALALLDALLDCGVKVEQERYRWHDCQRGAMKRTSTRDRGRRKQAARHRLSPRRLETLIQEALVDAYGEPEQAGAFHAMLEQELGLPFETTVLGVAVTVKRVDVTAGNGVVAMCYRGRARQAIAILDLPLPDPPPAGWAWIEAYRRWARGR